MPSKLFATALALLLVAGALSQPIVEPAMLGRSSYLDPSNLNSDAQTGVAPVIVPGWAFIATTNGAIYALNTSMSGPVLPSFNDTTYRNRITAMGRFSENCIYTIAYNAINIYEFNKTMVWSVKNYTQPDLVFDISSDFTYTWPLIVNATTRNILYVGSQNYSATSADGSHVIGLDSMGAVVFDTVIPQYRSWYKADAAYNGDWTLATPVVFFNVYNGVTSKYQLVKVGAFNGSVLGTYDVSDNRFEFVVNGSYIIANDQQGSLIILSAESGAQIKQQTYSTSSCSYLNWAPYYWMGSYLLSCDSSIFTVTDGTWTAGPTFTADSYLRHVARFNDTLMFSTNYGIFVINATNFAGKLPFYAPYNTTSYYYDQSQPTIEGIAVSPDGALIITTNSFLIGVLPAYNYEVAGVATTYNAQFQSYVVFDQSSSATTPRFYVASGTYSSGPGALVSFDASSMHGNNMSYTYSYSASDIVSMPYAYNSTGWNTLVLFEQAVSTIAVNGKFVNVTLNPALTETGNYQIYTAGNNMAFYMDSTLYNIDISTGVVTSISDSVCSVENNYPFVNIAGTWFVPCDDSSTGMQSFVAGSTTLTSYGSRGYGYWPAVTSTYIVFSQDSSTLVGFVPPATTGWTWASDTVNYVTTNAAAWGAFVFVAGTDPNYKDALFKVNALTGTITTTTFTPVTRSADFVLAVPAGGVIATDRVFVFNTVSSGFNVTVVDATTMLVLGSMTLLTPNSGSLATSYPAQPQVTPQGALIVSDSSNLYIYNVLTGSLAWTAAASTSVAAAVALNDYLFYNDGYRVVAADLFTGYIQYDYAYTGYSYTSITGFAVADGGNNQSFVTASTRSYTFGVSVPANPNKGGSFSNAGITPQPAGTPSPPSPPYTWAPGATWAPGTPYTNSPGYTAAPGGTAAPTDTAAPSLPPRPSSVTQPVKSLPQLNRFSWSDNAGTPVNSAAIAAPLVLGSLVFSLTTAYNTDNYTVYAYPTAPRYTVLPVISDLLISSQPPSWIPIAAGTLGVVLNDTFVVYSYTATSARRVKATTIPGIRFSQTGLDRNGMYSGVLAGATAGSAFVYLSYTNVSGTGSGVVKFDQTGMIIAWQPLGSILIPGSQPLIASAAVSAATASTPVHVFVTVMVSAQEYELLGLFLTTLAVDSNMTITFPGAPYVELFAIGTNPALAITAAGTLWILTKSSYLNVTLPATCLLGASPHTAYNNVYVTCGNTMFAYSTTTGAFVTNFTMDTPARGAIPIGTGSSLTWIIASSNSTFYILNSANANTGKWSPFYTYARYTETDSPSFVGFAGFSYGGDYVLANFATYAIRFPVSALLAAPAGGMVAPTSIVTAAALALAGLAVYDANTKLTFAASRTFADSANNGRFVQGFTDSGVMPSSFTYSFPASSGNGVYLFNNATSIAYYLSAWQLVIVNTSSGSAATFETSSYVPVDSTMDSLVLVNGYVCVISGCVSLTGALTGTFFAAPTPSSYCYNIGPVLAIGNYVLVPCGGWYNTDVIGYTYQPGFQSITTYGSATNTYSQNPVVFNQTLCGTSDRGFLECYTLDNSTLMSSSSPYVVYSNLAKSYDAIAMKWVPAFVAAKPSSGTVTAWAGTMNPWTGVLTGFTANGATIQSSGSKRQAIVTIATGVQYATGVMFIQVQQNLSAYAINTNAANKLMYTNQNAYPVNTGNNVPAPYATPQGALVFVPGNIPIGIVVYNAFNGSFAYTFGRVKQSIPTQVAGSQLFVVSSQAGGMFMNAMDQTSGTPLWSQGYAGASSSLGIIGFTARNGPMGTALVSYVQESAFVQTSFQPMPGASPVFPGGAAPATSAAEKSKTWIIAVVVGVLVVVILVAVVAKKKSAAPDTDQDYVPMNPAVQV